MFRGKNQELLRKTNIFQCSHCWAKTPAEQIFQVFQGFLSKKWICSSNPNHALTQIDVLGQSMFVVDSLQATSLIVYSLYSMVYSPYSVVYSVQSVVYGLWSKVYSLWPIVCSLQQDVTPYSMQYIIIAYRRQSIAFECVVHNVEHNIYTM